MPAYVIRISTDIREVFRTAVGIRTEVTGRPAGMPARHEPSPSPHDLTDTRCFSADSTSHVNYLCRMGIFPLSKSFKKKSGNGFQAKRSRQVVLNDFPDPKHRERNNDLPQACRSTDTGGSSKETKKSRFLGVIRCHPRKDGRSRSILDDLGIRYPTDGNHDLQNLTEASQH